MCWTIIERGGDYALVRQSLTDKKLRAPELAEQAEHAYRRHADSQTQSPRTSNRAWPPPTGRD